MLERLVIVISKHPEEYTGAKFVELPESGGSIGRNPGCSVPLVDHNRYISSTHCLVSIYGDAYYISDVSTNGLIVNGNKLLKNQPIPIHEGDSIVLGQYELSVSVERTTNTADIAFDITPDRDTTDPLANLDEVPAELEQQGPLEEIFLETKSDESDASDPMTHLDLSLDKSEDHLIRSENDEINQFAVTNESNRQIADDSLSVYSEFDAPSMIPEDWLGSADAEPKRVEKTPSSLAGQAQPKTTVASVSTPKQTMTSVPSEIKIQSAQWEEVAPTTDAQSPDVSEKPFSVATPEHSESDLLSSFKRGLGVTDDALLEADPHLFEQMGVCLRLCMTRLQHELVEIEELKQSPTPAETDLIGLMLDLNKQSMLSPNELVEQMLDEISEHKSLYEQALNNYVQQSISQYDPINFEQKSENKGFLAKQKLWDAYKLHYLESLKGVHGVGTKKLVQENYNRLLKEKYA
ncbi:type VI secretion system-associated FHA domain protein TagH [Vibrio neptunius]|uniref:Type VI secretion system-associated FHA domain protein TagH n=1 Tax=Vibrio neptunius TaxID=170651 RepID=A0ABS2ZXR5_9VIBR|nr:type VI secretion system-associated FHA domain protein TagH [Vibrio neptunius]MBN3492363.1 type VI secretion system-associated FHA domain protein TagH [Vibrio neptunius]MBN3514822.1 type VI secretion system-associated FHA domain protein TagH [Vibrio neptunius]MBN3549743.1 type VI secretion system-associated FHA domain protein TagH [Vibrio neptunius]MBN3576988.1 type VI secretion system-associated FHA domain protein TagH [Vibrio neptunius]MCH9870652.1 type VI secretion system-associated FHA 